MVTAVSGSDILSRARRSDREFDRMMSCMDSGEDITVNIVRRGVESAYNIGYLAGYTAAQFSVRNAIGIPEEG